MQAKTEYHLVAKWYTTAQDRELWKRLIAVTPTITALSEIERERER